MYKTNKKFIWKISGMVMLGLFVTQVTHASEITVPTVIKFVNAARNEQGLSNLKENETLDKIAADKAEDMIRNNYFAHTSPQGLNPWYWFEKDKYDYKYAGENLAINFLKAEDQQKAWMDSPTHRKNIMNANYEEIGVAVAAGEINGQMSIITVQEFGSLLNAADQANDKNFTATPKTNPLNDDYKVGPAVLSIKDLSVDKIINPSGMDQGSGSNLWEKMTRSMSDNRVAIGEFMWNISILLLMISIIASPFVVLLVAMRDIARHVVTKKQMATAQHD